MIVIIRSLIRTSQKQQFCLFKYRIACTTKYHTNLPINNFYLVLLHFSPNFPECSEIDQHLLLQKSLLKSECADTCSRIADLFFKILLSGANLSMSEFVKVRPH